MKVHVVLANAMCGIQYCGLFASSQEANKRLAQGAFGKNPRVVEFDVEGAQSEANVVYVAQPYNPNMDVHDFEGVFGNFESAQIASGANGQCLRITV